MRLVPRFGQAWRRLLALLLWCLLSTLALADTPPDEDGILTIDTAEAILVPEGASRREGLTDLGVRWDKDFPGLGGTASYRVQLPPHQGAQPMALLFSRIGNQAQVSINGSLLQSWGVLGDSLYDASKTPKLVPVPASLLRRDGPNELRVDLGIQQQRYGGLSVFRYGPYAAIEEIYDDHRVGRDLALLAFAVGLIGMSVFTGVLWLRQRDPMYGWFCLGALVGVLRIVERGWPDVPIGWPWLGALVVITHMVYMALMCRVSLLAVEPSAKRANALINGTIVLCAVLASLSFGLRKPLLLTLALASVVPMSLVVLGVTARRAWLGGELRARAFWLSLALAASIIAGLYDLIAVRLAAANGLRTTYLQHAMFAFVPIMGFMIATRYNRTVASFHELNADLSRRVREREDQLHAAFEALREQQQQQAVSNERQRIMREIHDGVGSQLVALLNMVARPGADSGVLREHVQLALDEMRMAVDSLQPANVDLATVLATLRYRLQPRLEAAGIAVEWEVAELPELQELSPNVVMHMQRILLEAFTNVLKHARASMILVLAQLREEDSTVVLQIADNGIGFHSDAGASTVGLGARARRRGGRGLDNMRSRAESIGARLRVDQPDTGGVCITLELKVERRPRPAAELA